MNIFFTIILALLFTKPVVRDNATISGNTNSRQGKLEIYSVTWSYWDYYYTNYANVSWNVTGGSIIASDKHSVTVQWNNLEGYEDATGQVSVSEDLTGQSGDLIVTVVNDTQGPSQFCNGVLGPPVIAIDFGSGPNPGPALSAGTTSYEYNPICAISANQYTIVNSTVGCRSQWHNIPADHTPNDVNGYFLLIDGNDQKNEFFRSTVSGLNPTLKYEFSAWVGNLSSIGENPKIRFEIYNQGTQIANSGTIEVPYNSTFQWEKIGFMFTLPNNVSSVDVVIVNMNTGSIGNDLVLDDIAFAACYPPILASFSSTSILDKSYTCDIGSVTLYSSWPNVIPYQNPAFQWQKSSDGGNNWTNIPNATSQSYTQTQRSPSIYQYRVIAFESSNPQLSVISNTLIFYVQQLVVDPKSTTFYSCEAVSGQIGTNNFRLLYSDPSINQTFSFLWSPSTYLNNPNTASPYINLPAPPPPNPSMPNAPINYPPYTLTITNTNFGCVGANTHTVTVLVPRKVYVPSAFTPDGDGLNDTFRPINLEDYPGAIFRVYNRWGQLIFFSQGPTAQDYSWDGTVFSNGFHQPQPSGTYVWTVEMPSCQTNIYSGSSGDGIANGTVVLIR